MINLDFVTSYYVQARLIDWVVHDRIVLSLIWCWFVQVQTSPASTGRSSRRATGWHGGCCWSSKSFEGGGDGNHSDDGDHDEDGDRDEKLDEVVDFSFANLFSCPQSFSSTLHFSSKAWSFPPRWYRRRTINMGAREGLRSRPKRRGSGDPWEDYQDGYDHEDACF